MAKATVLKCDKCDIWDSADNRVRTVSIAGPKMEMCTKCRAGVLIFVGIDPKLALRYQRMVANRDQNAGTWPALSTAKDWTPDGEPELPLDNPGEPTTDGETWASREERGEPSQDDVEIPDGEGDSESVAADTPEPKAPVRRGRAKG